jgi:hypothetical protein
MMIINYETAVAYSLYVCALAFSTTWLASVVIAKHKSSFSPAYDLVTPLAIALGAQGLAALILLFRQSVYTVVLDFFKLGCLIHAALIHSILLFNDWQNIRTRSAWYDAGGQKFLKSCIFQWFTTAISTLLLGAHIFPPFSFVRKRARRE